MTCTSNNGYPAPLFQWYLSSKKVTKDYDTQSSRNRNHRLDSISVINFTPTVDDHGKLLVCKVFQPNTASMEYLSASEVLQVLCKSDLFQLNLSSCRSYEAGTYRRLKKTLQTLSLLAIYCLLCSELKTISTCP